MSHKHYYVKSGSFVYTYTFFKFDYKKSDEGCNGKGCTINL